MILSLSFRASCSTREKLGYCAMHHATNCGKLGAMTHVAAKHSQAKRKLPPTSGTARASDSSAKVKGLVLSSSGVFAAARDKLNNSPAPSQGATRKLKPADVARAAKRAGIFTATGNLSRKYK
jgi:hypothetical protein